MVKLFQIVFKHGNVHNTGSDNLDIEYKKAYVSKDGVLILSKQSVTCLDGYEELKEYPGYLINVEKGSVINGNTFIECGSVDDSDYIRLSLKDTSGKFQKLRRCRVVYAHIHGEIEAGLHIDHIDGTTFKDSIYNLQKLTPCEHSRKTWSDPNNPKLIPAGKREAIRLLQLKLT